MLIPKRVEIYYTWNLISEFKLKKGKDRNLILAMGYNINEKSFLLD